MALLVGIAVGGCVALGLLAFFSITLNQQMRAKHPERKPYAWGYFLALFTIAAGVISIILGLMDYRHDGWAVYTGPLVIWLGALLYRRNRWAWLLFVFLQFNPGGWIINGTYLWRRWSEMGETDKAPSGSISTTRCWGFTSPTRLVTWWRNQSASVRGWIFLSGIWIALVWLVVMIFQPFGSELYSEEYTKLIFIMSVPLLGGGIKFTYDRVVK